MYEAVKEVFKDAFARERQEGRQEGLQEGRQEGINANRESLAVDMLKDGKPMNEITRYSKLTESFIRSLALSMGLAIS